MATKSDKEKLDEGAKAIDKAKAEAEAVKPMVIPKSTRDIKEIVAERVTVLPLSIGLKLADDTPIEEVLRIQDWATTMSDHVGFMIGDIINFGRIKWGDDAYRRAMEQTGRGYSTVAGYAETARKIPAAKRQAALSYTHHREILRIGDEEKVVTVLKEVASKAEKDGKIISTSELRNKVKQMAPRPKRKKGKGKSTSGKGKGKDKPLPPPYKPTDAERERLDDADIALEEASKRISKLYPLVAKLDNKEKQRWVKLAEPIVVFYNAVDKVTGY